MPKLDDLINANSDVDFFEKLLKRAEQRTNDSASVEQDFVQDIYRRYKRQGDALMIEDAELERLRKIASGTVALRRKPMKKPRKAVKKKKKVAKKKVAANG